MQITQFAHVSRVSVHRVNLEGEVGRAEFDEVTGNEDRAFKVGLRTEKSAGSSFEGGLGGEINASLLEHQVSGGGVVRKEGANVFRK